MIVAYDDMTDEQRRIVDAGQEIAGEFPAGLSKEELSQWIIGMMVIERGAPLFRRLAQADDVQTSVPADPRLP